jgi:NADPH:quinone reductase-like Zn-dependent oxidoreductase
MRLVLGVAKPKRPILGGYFSGAVVAAGMGVSNFKQGDPVFGTAGLRLGAHGEYVCLPASTTIVPKPHNIGFEAAAAAPLGGLNALHFLRRANIQKGETVLVNGAGGSIGIFGVQIAKAMGAEVTAVDGPHKEALLRSIGADHYIDYTTEDFTKRGQTYDVIFSMVASRSFSDCLGALTPKGRYLMANPKVSDMLRSAVTPIITLKKAVVAFAGEKKEELIALKEMIEKGTIKPVVDTVYSFEQAAEAHRRVETEQRLGAVIISAHPPILRPRWQHCRPPLPISNGGRH